MLGQRTDVRPEAQHGGVGGAQVRACTEEYIAQTGEINEELDSGK